MLTGLAPTLLTWLVVQSDDTALAHSAIEVILRHYQDVFRASRPAGALPMFAEYTNSSETPGIFKCVMSGACGAWKPWANPPNHL